MAQRLSDWGEWGAGVLVRWGRWTTRRRLTRSRGCRWCARARRSRWAGDFDQRGPHNAPGGATASIPFVIARDWNRCARWQRGPRQAALRRRYGFVAAAMRDAMHRTSLGHIFFRDKMWNGYDARLVDPGAKKNGIHKRANRMIGAACCWISRGSWAAIISEDVIWIAELDACAKAQNVEVRRGDFAVCVPPGGSSVGVSAMRASTRRATPRARAF